MAAKTSDRPAAPSSQANEMDPAWPADVASTLSRIQHFLRAGKPEDALALLSQTRRESSWLTNAAGVCLLRQGKAEQALVTFRSLALGTNGFSLREDAAVRFKTNYAAAQVLCGMHTACVITLSQIRAEADPSVRRLREGIRRWQGALSFWQRCRLFVGGEVGPVTLEQPGEL